MFDDFFSKTFYGNTVFEWLITAGIIVLSLVLGKLLYWFFSKIMKQLAKRTKTKLDDIIVDKIEEPVVFAFVLAGVWYGLSYLSKGEGMNEFIEKVYYILIIFNITWMFTRLFDSLVVEYLAPLVNKTESSLDNQLLPVFRKGFKGAFWIIAAILALNNAGYDVGALIAGLGIGGLAFALAAQDLVKNLFGGFTIFVDKPFTVGDRIKVSGYDGIVEEIGIRNLRIRTIEGRMVIIPNSEVANKPIENVTSEPSRRVELNIALALHTEPQKATKAVEILKDITTKNSKLVLKTAPKTDAPEINAEKKILLGLNHFNNLAINIMFVYFIKPNENVVDVQNEINLAILLEFRTNEIEFAFQIAPMIK